MSASRPIVLQKSKVAVPRIFRENTKQEAIADSYRRNCVGEVASWICANSKRVRLVSHAAGVQQRPLLPQFKNVGTLRTLEEKSATQDGVSQFRRSLIKQRAKKTLAGSER
jgi:hypothetical protein